MKNEKKIQLTDEFLTNFLSYHFHYEVGMLMHCISGLMYMGNAKIRGEEVNLFERHVYIESFVNHTRSLILFFYDVNKSKHHPNDALAIDFFENTDDWVNIRGEISPILNKFRERAGTEVMHLTYNRKNENDPTKSWDLHSVPLIFEIIHKFIKAVPQKYHSERFLEFLKIHIIIKNNRISIFQEN